MRIIINCILNFHIQTGDYSLSNCPTPAQGREIRDGEAACTYSGNQVRAQTVKKHAPEEIIVDRSHLQCKCNFRIMYLTVNNKINKIINRHGINNSVIMKI